MVWVQHKLAAKVVISPTLLTSIDQIRDTTCSQHVGALGVQKNVHMYNYLYSITYLRSLPLSCIPWVSC